MMGMQTMQAQQPMQGGGKGSMIQPQQYSQGTGSMDMPQQPMPQDMGRGYGMNREHRQGGGEGGGYGGELPTDYVGNTAQQQSMPGMGQIPQNYAVNGSSVVRSSFNGDPNGGSINGGPRIESMPQQPMQGGGKATGGMGQSMGQQPRFGQPNRYSNTTQQPWDNANINPQPSGKGAGGMGGAGGKGAGMQQGGQMQGGGKGQAGGGFPTALTNFGQPTQTAAYPTAQTNFGQGTPLTQPTAPVTNTASPDEYIPAFSGGQGA